MTKSNKTFQSNKTILKIITNDFSRTIINTNLTKQKKQWLFSDLSRQYKTNFTRNNDNDHDSSSSLSDLTVDKR
jgi:hypothetical protein